MPFDENGDWIEDSEQAPEQTAPSSNIEEYLRRARVQAAMNPMATQEETPYPGQVPNQASYQPGPAMGAYKETIGQEPLHQNYHPSALRRIVAGLAGAGAGVAGGGDAGVKAATGIKEAPYQRQLRDYQQSLAQKGQLAGMEATGNAAAQKYYLDLAKVQHENAQGAAEVARRQAEVDRGSRFKWLTSPQHHVEELENIGARGTKAAAPGVQTPWKVVTKDGKTHVGILQPGGAFKEGDVIIPTEQIDADKTAKLGQKESVTNTRPVVVAPGASVMDPKDPSKVLYNNPKAPGAANEGTWSIQEDDDGNPVQFNNKTGQVRPVSGLHKAGTSDKLKAAQEKEQAPVKAAQDYGHSYLSNGVFTGAGDEALQEKFFELAKPSTGFRMTQPQMNMLAQSRGWMQGMEAHVRHATSGTWFSDEQRQQIVKTMDDLAKSKLTASSGVVNSPDVPQVGQTFNGSKVLKVTKIN